MFKKAKKTKFVIIAIVLIIVSFVIFEAQENTGEKYSTSAFGLEVAKASEVIELQDGDTLDLSIDIIQKEIAGQVIKMFGYNGQIPGPLLKIKQNSTILVNVL